MAATIATPSSKQMMTMAPLAYTRVMVRPYAEVYIAMRFMAELAMDFLIFRICELKKLYLRLKGHLKISISSITMAPQALLLVAIPKINMVVLNLSMAIRGFC